MADPAHPAGLLPLHRLEALTDGIFAVAMTLLVIELKLPEHAGIHSAHDLAQALANLLPKFGAWLVSFFVLAMFWFGHHRIFAFVRRADGKLVALNLAELAFVSLMPFSSALTGEYGSLLLAQVVFSTNMALLGVVALARARYVFHHPELGATPPLPPALYRGARLRIGGLIAISAVAVILAALIAWPGIGNAAFMLMAVLTPLSRRLEQRQLRREAGTAAAQPAA